MRLRNLILTIAAFSGVAFAQGGHVDLPAIFSQSSSPMQIAGLNVTVCLSTATVTNGQCSPTVSTFSDQALTQPIANLQTNGDGLFPFWISPGNYQYCLSGSPIVSFCNPFTVGVAPGSSPSFANVNLPSGGFICWNADSGITRTAAKSFKIGDCAGSSDGTLALGTLNASGVVSGSNIPAGTIDSGTGITNTISKFTNGSAGVQGNSGLTDNGTTIATAEDIAPCSLATASYIYVACQGSWAAALSACPSAGCILDGRASTTPRAIGTFDVGTKTVGIWLGPYLDFTAVQITMRSGLTMIGMGSGRGNTTEGTAITSVGSNGTPLFVIPQSNNVSAANLLFKGIHFIGATSNTSQEGFFTDASTLTNAGLWYSLFEDLYFTNFAGASIHLKAPATAGAVATNQFNTFINVTALRVSGGSLFSLNIDGPNGQNTFINSEFSGPFGGPLTGTNIRVGVNGVSTGTSQPYSNYFIGVTCQYGDVCATIEGSLDTRFINPHLEQLHGGWLCSQPTSAGNAGVSVIGGIVAGTVGVNSGSGYVVSGGNCNTSASGWVMDGTTIQGTPDAIVINPGGIAPSTSIRTLNLARTNFNGNYKAVHATGLTGTTGTQVLLASPPPGIYQVCGYIQTTTVGNAVTGTLAFQYNNGSAQTITSSTIAINTANNQATIPCQQIFMATSQNLSYTGTISAGIGAGVYRIDAEITPIAQQ